MRDSLDESEDLFQVFDAKWPLHQRGLRMAGTPKHPAGQIVRLSLNGCEVFDVVVRGNEVARLAGLAIFGPAKAWENGTLGYMGEP